MDFDKILIPNFSNDEPSITSTRKKNENGKCCFHKCDNDLPKDKEHHYFGFLACEDCWRKNKEALEKELEADWANFVNTAIEIAKIK